MTDPFIVATLCAALAFICATYILLRSSKAVYRLTDTNRELRRRLELAMAGESYWRATALRLCVTHHDDPRRYLRNQPTDDHPAPRGWTEIRS